MEKSLLLTDLYELTMIQAWMEEGRQDTEASFDLIFRKNPFSGGYTIAAGIEDLVAFLCKCSFTAAHIKYLSSLNLFTEEFLDLLINWKFKGKVYSVPEGTPVFPNEPFIRIEGPLWSVQLIETVVLNLINFQSLIATKASRVCNIAGWNTVLEFGARRAQGQDGALSASKAAFLGGCASTSNLYAGLKYGIPVSGTHAHSFVMAARDEIRAFRQYSMVYPDKSTLLIDTYDPIKKGLPHAIEVAKEMEACGKQLSAIRIDSGNIISISKTARTMLDEAGLSYVKIIASGDLDEYRILAIKEENAPVDLFGVGTRLVTGYPDSALGGVYKLSAICNKDGLWEGRLKTTADSEKSTLPGKKQIWRAYSNDWEMIGDYIELESIDETGQIIDNKFQDFGEWGKIEKDIARVEPLVQLHMENGLNKVDPLSLTIKRENVIQWCGRIPNEMKRLHNPEIYPVLKGPNLQKLTKKILMENYGENQYYHSSLCR